MFELGKKLAESLIECPKQHRIEAVLNAVLFQLFGNNVAMTYALKRFRGGSMSVILILRNRAYWEIFLLPK